MHEKTGILAQVGAAVAFIFGSLSLEAWIAIGGLMVSLLSFWSNRSFKAKDERRKQELHDLRMSRVQNDRRKRDIAVTVERRHCETDYESVL